MKNTLRAGLAAVAGTVVIGPLLATGAPALATTPAATPRASPDSVELVVATLDGFAYVPEDAERNDVFSGRAESRAEAATRAQSASVLANADGSFALWNDATDVDRPYHCLAVYQDLLYSTPGTSDECRAADESRFRVVDGVVVLDHDHGSGLRSALTSTERLSVGPGGEPARLAGLNDLDGAETPAPEAPGRVTLDHAFGATPADRGTLSGTAAPGAVVAVYAGIAQGGTLVLRTFADPVTGAFHTEIPAPDAPGTVVYTARQTVEGVPDDRLTQTTVDYGAGVAVTSPAAGEVVETGAAVTVEGTGQDGAVVTVRDTTRDLEIGSTTVADGIWAITTSPVEAGPTTFEATQVSAGQNSTTATVDVVTADDGGPVVAPVTLSAPADPAAGYAPNTPFTFSGTATPGVPVKIENKYGTSIATTTTDADGAWSWTRANLGTSTWHLNFIQMPGTPQQSQTELRGFAPRVETGQPVTREPVTLAAPTDPQAGYVANTSFTFTGTATAGAPIAIVNTFGTLVTTVTTDADGVWTWARANLGTSTWNLDFVQDRGTAEQTQAELRGFAPRR